MGKSAIRKIREKVMQTELIMYIVFWFCLLFLFVFFRKTAYEFVRLMDGQPHNPADPNDLRSGILLVTWAMSMIIFIILALTQIYLTIYFILEERS